MATRKKPVKAAAKKPAAVDYKKKYEALLKAAKAAGKEYDAGQITCECSEGRYAMANLLSAAGIAAKFENGSIQVTLHSIPVMLTHHSDLEVTVKIDGIEVPKNCIEAECYEESA